MTRPSVSERFAAKYIAEPNTGCWLWLDRLNWPDHLFLGDQKDNANDRAAKGRGWRGGNGRGQWTHCSHGHKYTDGNVYRAPSGQRVCRTCKRARSAAGYRRRKTNGISAT
jgi:hypothetical protein